MRKSVKIAGIGVGAVVAIIIITSGGSKAPAPAATTVSAPTATATTALPAPAAQAPASPVPPPAQASGPARQFDAGTYEVGTDIKAGKYKTAGPGSDDILKSCYWARSKDSSGDFDALITNGIVQGPSVVTTNKGEVLKASGGCTWTFAG